MRLRYRGSAEVIALGEAERWTVGSDPECSLALQDPSGRVSRKHAELVRDGDAWSVRDLGSTNGIRHNGDTRRAFQLAPGDEIEFGGVALIAESVETLALHELLRRFIGWSPAALPDVDRAMRGVRDFAHMRSALSLCGEGSLLGVARRIHDMVLGGRAFATLEKDERGRDALSRASNGTLVIRCDALPTDLQLMIAGLRVPDTRVRLIVCGSNAESFTYVGSLLPQVATLWIPPLAGRGAELGRLIEAYGDDAAASLGAPSHGFRPQDADWLRASAVDELHTLAEIGELTHRLVALRNWGVAGGAARLGITHGALSRWAKRRKLPT